MKVNLKGKKGQRTPVPGDMLYDEDTEVLFICVDGDFVNWELVGVKDEEDVACFLLVVDTGEIRYAAEEELEDLTFVKPDPAGLNLVPA